MTILGVNEYSTHISYGDRIELDMLQKTGKQGVEQSRNSFRDVTGSTLDSQNF